jgi:hypothetical protein
MADEQLPPDIMAALHNAGLPTDEIGLRQALESRISGYDLHRLTPAAAKRWKCKYRIMTTVGFYDGDTVAEVYARALLAFT